MSAVVVQFGAWWQWLTLPWRQWTVAVAVVVSTAAPIGLAVGAGLWLTGEQDALAAVVLADASLVDNGVDVTLEAQFSPDTLAPADRQLTEAAASIGALGEVTRTLYTLPGLLAIASDDPDGRLRSVGPAGRLFARAGALEHVTIVDQLDDTDRGVWISTSFATRHELVLGDGIGFEAGAIADEQWNDIVQGGGAGSVFRIVGTYEPLWSEATDPADDAYWAAVPDEVVPQFLSAGVGPSSELVLAAESTVLDSGLTGVARWTAPLVAWPDDYSGLVALNGRVARFERDLVGSGPLAASMLDLATVAQASPRVHSEIGETTKTARSAAGLLIAPLHTARTVGTLVGLVAMAAVGVFFVERNHVAFRLLVAEGTGPFALALRIGGLLFVPVAIGACLAVGMAAPVIDLVGPEVAAGVGAVDLGVVVLVAALVIVFTSAVGALWAVRAARPFAPDVVRALATTSSAGVVGLAVVAWIQIGRTRAVGGDSIDLAVVLLPLLATAAGSIIVLALVGLLGRVAAERSERMPVLGLLTVARAATSSVALRMSALVLGLGVGLVVFAVAFVETTDHALDLRLATEVGGVSRVQIIDPLPEGDVLDRSTVVGEFDTGLSVTGTRVLVLAIDPDTYAAAVDWPADFGLDPDTALGLLDRPVGDRVPAIAIEGQAVPERGEFGFAQTYPFEIVDRVRSMPGAAEGRPTIMLLADALDTLALRRAGFDSVAATVGTTYRPPTDRFRQIVVSERQIDVLLPDLDRLGVRTRDPVSQRELRTDPDVIASRSVFGYLGLLGGVGAIGAIGALLSALAVRRRQRSLSAVLLRSMGFGPGRSATVTVIEVGGLVVAMFATAGLIAPLTVGRVAGRFDPAPGFPPPIGLEVDWLPIVVGAAGALLTTGVLLWWVEWRAGRRLPAEVLDAR